MLITRHGRKQYHNFKNSKLISNGYPFEDVPPLDPDLTNYGKEESYESYIYYCEKMGKAPTKIVTSPLIRNRSSAMEARKAIYDYFKVYVEIESEPSIGEYFHKKYLPLKKSYFNDSTWRLLGKESYSMSTDEDINLAINKFLINRQDNVWYITHGYFIMLLCQKLEIPAPSFNYNEGLILSYDLNEYHVMKYDEDI